MTYKNPKPYIRKIDKDRFHHPAASILVIGLERDGSMFQAYQREGGMLRVICYYGFQARRGHEVMR